MTPCVGLVLHSFVSLEFLFNDILSKLDKSPSSENVDFDHFVPITKPIFWRLLTIKSWCSTQPERGTYVTLLEAWFC